MNEVLKTDQLTPENKELICMVGLPYSGKSTFAKTIGCPIVCPDAIRVALHGNKFITEAEPMIWTIAKYMVKSLFLAGHSIVIVDATNTTLKRRNEWISSNWKTVFRFIDTPKDVCIERAKLNGDFKILPIIEKMSDEFEGLTNQTVIKDFERSNERY